MPCTLDLNRIQRDGTGTLLVREQCLSNLPAKRIALSFGTAKP